MSHAEGDERPASAEVPSSTDLLKRLARVMSPIPPKLKSLDRNEVKSFLDEHKEYGLSHGSVELRSLLELGLLKFFEHCKRATTDEEILHELKEIVSPSSASAFEKEFLQVVFDLSETDGVQKVTKLFSDFEIALEKTNLAPPTSGIEKEYVLTENEQCSMLMEKLPDVFKAHVTREKRYRVIETKKKLYELLCKLAKDWNWVYEVKSSSLLEKEVKVKCSSTGTTTTGMPHTLDDARQVERAKQSQRVKSRVQQILGQN